MLDKSGLSNAYRAAALVTQLAVVTAVGVFIGAKLDGWLQTGPWLTLLFSGLGFAAGNARLFQELQRLQQKDDGPDDHSS